MSAPSARAMTAQELARAERVQTAEDWKAYTEEVKAARGGAYPSDWWQLMKQSGYMDRILARFGQSSDLKVTGVATAVAQPLLPQQSYYAKQIATLSAETQAKIVASELKRFSDQLEAGKRGDRGIRVGETEAYVMIWQAGEAALAAGLPLPIDCQNEMGDALYSGECDHLMTEAERKAWNELMAQEESDL